MKRDFIVAGLLALLGISCLYQPIRNPVVIAFWHPVSLTGLIVLLATLLFLRWDLSALVLVAVYLYIYNNSSIQNLEERRVEVEVSEDNDRFDARTSIDIQFAEGTVKHAPPSILGWTKDAAPLLLYPPTTSTLNSLNG